MLLHQMRNLFMVTSLGTIAAAPLARATVVIDFETVPGVTANPFYLGGYGVPPGSHLTTELRSTYGVTFTSTAGYVHLVNLGVGHATSGVNGIGGVASGNIADYASPVDITFSLPGSPLVPTVTSIVSMSFDQNHVAGTATIEAFTLGGASLGTVTAFDTAGGVTISAGSPIIHSVRLTQTSGTIAYDDLSFGELTTAAVPEASAFVAWAAIIGCVGGVKGIRKARRRARPSPN
jgi:hypothetical protein